MDTWRRFDVGYEYGAGLLTAECSRGTRRLTTFCHRVHVSLLQNYTGWAPLLTKGDGLRRGLSSSWLHPEGLLVTNTA